MSGRNIPHNVSKGISYVTMCEYRARHVVYNKWIGPLFIIFIIFFIKPRNFYTNSPKNKYNILEATLHFAD